ncbi:conserved oligomeric Golgi complex subunit 8 [Condylostylus longicornis]|uniref:conserved oligomeric Golgi complex subunit 8 n=1 Tax=Condylostylus longicornis TaxID=2530218 RepID=UPI00244DBADA|nr:conserved oligomeric Golgi complex subunit 8 [Condylostylus longicornis]
MDYESDRVLKLIFSNDVPGYDRDKDEISLYLTKLGNYKIGQLKKEENRLEDENKLIEDQTLDLAVLNYRTIIQTSDCSKKIYAGFVKTENRVENLLQPLSVLEEKCQRFLESTADINSKKNLNLSTSKNYKKVLEILEIPQLMEYYINEGHYEEALELASYVQKLGTKHSEIGVIKGVVLAVEKNWHSLLIKFLDELKTDLQLPKCLQVFGHLRRMQAFGSNELKLIFLHTRDTWLNNLLSSIPKDDAQNHLTKTIEVTRINVFNIMTQYKALFPNEDVGVSSNFGSCEGKKLFNTWLNKKIETFLNTLEEDLNRGVSSLDTALGQCMYFGGSFSRIGVDFRALVVSIFVRVITKNFVDKIINVNTNFDYDMKNFTLVNSSTITLHQKIRSTLVMGEVNATDLSPPESLLDYTPLAILCNGYLSALSELMLCAPISLVFDVVNTLERSLERVSHGIYQLYKREKQVFSAIQRENFIKFLSSFAYDLCPYIQRCLQAVFPQQVLANHLGITLLELQNERISFMNQNSILDPIKNLLPERLSSKN